MRVSKSFRSQWRIDAFCSLDIIFLWSYETVNIAHAGKRKNKEIFPVFDIILYLCINKRPLDMQNRSHFSVLILEQAKKYGSRTAVTYQDFGDKDWKTVSWN